MELENIENKKLAGEYPVDKDGMFYSLPLFLRGARILKLKKSSRKPFTILVKSFIFSGRSCYASFLGR